MAIAVIDGKKYDTDKLSDDVKGSLVSMQFVDAEIQRHQAMLAVLQNSRNAYAQAVSEGLKKIKPEKD